MITSRIHELRTLISKGYLSKAISSTMNLIENINDKNSNHATKELYKEVSLLSGQLNQVYSEYNRGNILYQSRLVESNRLSRALWDILNELEENILNSKSETNLVQILISIEISYQSFDEKRQVEFVNQLKSMLKEQSNIEIKNIDSGSVLLTIEIQEKSYRELNTLFRNGKLKELKITNLILATNRYTNQLIEYQKNRDWIDLRDKNLEGLNLFNRINSAVNKLYLSNCNIKEIKELSNFKELLILDISYNPLKNISSLKDIKKLRNLNLSNTNIKTIDSLKTLTQLRKLKIENSKIEEIKHLGGLTNLNELRLSFSEVSDIKSLDKLMNLELLYLAGTKIKKIPTLKNLKKLYHFDLGYTPLTDISNISSLDNLFSLNLQGVKNVYEFNSLTRLNKIKHLDLSYSNISDSDFSWLSKMATLFSLRIIGTKISDSMVISLRNELPNCRIFFKGDGGNSLIHSKEIEYV